MITEQKVNKKLLFVLTKLYCHYSCWLNQGKYFENAGQCKKRNHITDVATRFKGEKFFEVRETLSSFVRSVMQM